MRSLSFIGLMILMTFGGITQTTTVQAQSGCPAPQGLVHGAVAYVIPGPANALRDLPGTSDSGSRVIGEIDGGEFFTVIEGPICADGYNWWLVSTANGQGYTADGTFSEPWLAPLICTNSPLPRLYAGMQATVTPGDPNSIRAQPGSGARLGTIPAGGVFDVLSNPQCGADGRTWYRVDYNGVTGWTAEGDPGVYWLAPAGLGDPTIPVTPTLPPSTGCALAPRLRIGGTGMVVPGLPNVLRDAPGLNASGSRVIGNLQEGAIFTVLNGPVCRDGHQWWQVTAGGMTGWTAEGENTTYWLDPLMCANGMMSQIAPGMRARVTPGLPQRVRTSPSTTFGAVIARIPAGGTMFVLNNFQCDEVGRLWWQVIYFGRIGWVAEGENGVYWLEPA